MATVGFPIHVLTLQHVGYGRATPEDLINGDHDPFYVYNGTKILAEAAAWKFAEEHPELDLATSTFVHHIRFVCKVDVCDTEV